MLAEWVSMLQSCVLTNDQGLGFISERLLLTFPIKIGFVSMSVWARALTLSFGDHRYESHRGWYENKYVVSSSKMVDA